MEHKAAEELATKAAFVPPSKEADLAAEGSKKNEKPGNSANLAHGASSSLGIDNAAEAHIAQSTTAMPSSQQNTNLLLNTDTDKSARVDSTKQQIGPLVVLKTLGEGSFGKVKLAIHAETRQKYALKFISRQLLKKPDMSSRVDREIAYLKLLRHPHIIKLFDVIPTPTDFIMVIEYAGREFFDYIVQNGRMNEVSARRFFQQIICAVDYCHRHKIVHRDLKPENLLLDENLNVKIADFGLSNLMTDGNFLKTSCGSPNYAAPEVINGKLYAGPEVDIWSCGVILYVTLVGRLPFDDEYIPSLFKKISNGIYTLPQWLPSGPTNLLKKMLIVDSIKRITMQEIKNDAWFQQDLPEYLKAYDENLESNEIDQDAVAKLAQRFNLTVEAVIESLTSQNPNDMQDAYKIIAENQALKAKSKLLPVMDTFNLSQSPPPWEAFEIQNSIRSPCTMTSMNLPSVPTISELASATKGGRKGTISDLSSVIDEPNLSVANTIKVLHTSKPSVHLQLMRSRKGILHSSANMNASSNSENLENKLHRITLDEKHNNCDSKTLPIGSQSTISPSSESILEAPETSKIIKLPKWHFGIRSRSAPLEVLSEIYRALKMLGAEFQHRLNVTTMDALTEKYSMKTGRHRSSSAASRIANSSTDNVKEGSSRENSNQRIRASSIAYNPTRENPHKSIGLPKDLFSIRCRWIKYDDDQKITGVRVYVDVQLYALDRECYLVDFKCCGYEDINHGQENGPQIDRIKSKISSHANIKEESVESSFNNYDCQMSRTTSEYTPDSKRVSSPFPFLEVSARLIQSLI